MRFLPSIGGIVPALRGGALSIGGSAPALRGGAMSVPWVLAVVALLAAGTAGCGDDDSDDDTGPGDSGTSGSGGGGGPRIDAGPPGEGPGDEGWPCTSTDPCNGDLRCATTPFAVGGEPLGVCGVACDVDGDCNGGRCISYSGAASDAHCVDVIEDEYEICGVADTSVCSEDLTCLYFPDLPVGVCVSLCSNAAAGGDDAGVDEPTATCSGEQSCIEGILADPTPGEGVCGMMVERGEPCGLDLGLYCGEGDVCAPEDSNDETSTPRCFQDCSTNGSECEDGTCVLLRNVAAYCI